MKSGCTPTYLPFWISFILGSSEKCDFETDLCKPLHEVSLHSGWIRRNGNSGVGPPYSDHNGNDTGKSSCLHWRNHRLLHVIHFCIICLSWYFLDNLLGSDALFSKIKQKPGHQSFLGAYDQSIIEFWGAWGGWRSGWREEGGRKQFPALDVLGE